MKVRQLEAFQAVVTSGSVTRAAERLSISQPAVSQLLNQLEKACGFRLFDRRAGKVLPTREAEALYAEVQRVFVGVDRIDRAAAAIREQSWGSLRIAAFPAIARRIVPEVILDFRKTYPQTRFHVQSMRARSVIDAVASQQVDLGICSIPGDRPEVESSFLQNMRAVCIVPSTHRLAEKREVTAQELDGEAFISLGFYDNSKNIIDPVFDQLNVSRKIDIECGQSETIYSFVAGEAGISVIDPLCVYNVDGLRDPRVRVLSFTPSIPLGVWLVKAKSRRPFNLVDNFEQWISEQLTGKLILISEMMGMRT